MILKVKMQFYQTLNYTFKNFHSLTTMCFEIAKLNGP
jgi:hypothetical protein